MLGEVVVRSLSNGLCGVKPSMSVAHYGSSRALFHPINRRTEPRLRPHGPKSACVRHNSSNLFRVLGEGGGSCWTTFPPPFFLFRYQKGPTCPNGPVAPADLVPCVCCCSPSPSKTKYNVGSCFEMPCSQPVSSKHVRCGYACALFCNPCATCLPFPQCSYLSVSLLCLLAYLSASQAGSWFADCLVAARLFRQSETDTDLTAADARPPSRGKVSNCGFHCQRPCTAPTTEEVLVSAGYPD